MLDTAFIRDGREDTRLVVYIYRSAMLRRQVLYKLTAQARSRQRDLMALSPDDLFATLTGTSLFADLGEFVCDLGKALPRGLFEAIEGSEGLRANANGVVAILLHEDNPLLKDLRWEAFAGRCHRINELACAPEHLEELTLVAADAIGLPHRSVLNTGPAQALLGVLVEESDDLPGFVSAAKAAHYAGEFEQRSSRGHRALTGRVGAAVQALVFAPSRHAVLELLGSVSAQLQLGCSETQLCRTLVRATHSQMRRHLKAQIGRDHYVKGVMATRRLLAWSVFIISALQREGWGVVARYRPQPARLVPWLDAVAGKYLAWCEGNAAAPQSQSESDSWGYALTENLRSTMSKLVNNLPKQLEPDWLAALRPNPQRSDEVAEERFEAVTSIVGQRVAVRELQDRIVRGSTETPLLLVGPPGIGKRTLAMAYAKASLCEAPVAGFACGKCTSCVDVAHHQSWMYVAPIDIAGADEQLITSIQKTMARGNSFAERLAMVLMNVDRLAPDLLDRLLKTVEEPGRDVVLVMTATQLRDVRVAVRSRSRTIKLRRLSVEECVQFVGARTSSLPPTAIDMLLATLDADARGLPHLMERACRKMLADGRLST